MNHAKKYNECFREDETKQLELTVIADWDVWKITWNNEAGFELSI